MRRGPQNSIPSGASCDQVAARFRGRRGRERFGLLDLGQGVAHAIEIELAGIGQRQAAGRAVDQARAQMLLDQMIAAVR